jgi:hemerythrin-like domain-containing protein
MKPIGPLMIEHRLIEQMAELLSDQAGKIESEGKADVKFLLDAVDFFRVYADKVHHGKEEHILFSDLQKKELSKEHRDMLNQLLNEHAIGRAKVMSLAEATKQYANGNRQALKDIAAIISTLSQLYITHIEKEDRHFFIPVLEYFGEEEQTAMLQKMLEFDKTVDHQKYRDMVASYKEKK